LVDLFEYIMMHGLTNPKFIILFMYLKQKARKYFHERVLVE